MDFEIWAQNFKFWEDFIIQSTRDDSTEKSVRNLISTPMLTDQIFTTFLRKFKTKINDTYEAKFVMCNQITVFFFS